MASWKKVKNLFWQSGDGGGSAHEGAAPAGGDAEMSDADFAAMLESSPHAVPKDAAAERVAPGSVPVTVGAGGLTIDFQAQYDLAGIPDTDEVEQLENFLARLDASLPKASKIAAAQAFLGAIGKDKNAVLQDAERKIRRVRGILESKNDETRRGLAEEQAGIDELAAKIEAHRKRMEELNRELEGVRQACLVEESRLQAARVFFGNVDPPGPGGAPVAGQR